MLTTLFLAWRGEPSLRWWPIGRLTYDGSEYAFAYTKGAQAAASEAGFRPLLSFPDLSEVYLSKELFPMFANRVLQKGRPDYPNFVDWLDLDGGEADSLALLARSGGRKETDMFEVFPAPVAGDTHRYRAVFFVHGLRHYPEALERAVKLRREEPLCLRAEPENPVDPKAFRILSDDGVLLGYVPRYLCGDIHALQEACAGDVHLSVRRVNGPRTPLQFVVLCSLEACWPDGFEACSGPDFQPIRTLVGAGDRTS